MYYVFTIIFYHFIIIIIISVNCVCWHGMAPIFLFEIHNDDGRGNQEENTKTMRAQ